MSRLIRFFTKILDICKLVPMLPVVVIAAIPLALLGDWRPWGNAMAIPVLGNPGFGQWLVIALVLVIVIDTVRGMMTICVMGRLESMCWPWSRSSPPWPSPNTGQVGR